MDIMKKGAEWLEAQRTKHFAKEVTYKRGTDTVSVLATCGKTEFEVQDEYGNILQKVESRDFIVSVQALVINNVSITPQRGDMILEDLGDTTFTYQVAAPNNNEPVFRYSDNYKLSFRIHTKEVGTT